MTDASRPKVGVAAIIHDSHGNIIMGERAGSHGAGLCSNYSNHIFNAQPKAPLGTMQCPGGHLEYGESFAETAARETLEETGLEVGDIKFLVATNDVFGEGKHYVTIFVTCKITGQDKVPKVCVLFLCPTSRTDAAQPMEPHKCAKWEWVPWTDMWSWAAAQAEAEDEGREVQKKMFLPLVNLFREYPEMRNCLENK
jgi:8-oxo-dGTP diphosphatase